MWKDKRYYVASLGLSDSGSEYYGLYDSWNNNMRIYFMGYYGCDEIVATTNRAHIDTICNHLNIEVEIYTKVVMEYGN